VILGRDDGGEEKIPDWLEKAMRLKQEYFETKNKKP